MVISNPWRSRLSRQSSELDQTRVSAVFISNVTSLSSPEAGAGPSGSFVYPSLCDSYLCAERVQLVFAYGVMVAFGSSSAHDTCSFRRWAMPYARSFARWKRPMAVLPVLQISTRSSPSQALHVAQPKKNTHYLSQTNYPLRTRSAIPSPPRRQIYHHEALRHRPPPLGLGPLYPRGTEHSHR